MRFCAVPPAPDTPFLGAPWLAYSTSGFVRSGGKRDVSFLEGLPIPLPLPPAPASVPSGLFWFGEDGEGKLKVVFLGVDESLGLVVLDLPGTPNWFCPLPGTPPAPILKSVKALVISPRCGGVAGPFEESSVDTEFVVDVEVFVEPVVAART